MAESPTSLIAIAIFGIARLFSKIIGKPLLWCVVLHRPTPMVFQRYLEFFSYSDGVVGVKNLNDTLSLRKSGVFINLSLDDGWLENLELMALLKTHSLKIDLYVCPGLVETGLPPWNFFVPDRKKLNADLNKRLKHASLESRNLQVMPLYNNAKITKRHMLSWAQLEAAKEFFDIHLHSHSHQPLPTLSQEELKHELYDARKLLGRFIGEQCEYMSFPYGYVDERVLSSGKFKICRGFNQPRFIVFKDSLKYLPATGLSDSKFSIKDLIYLACRGMCQCILH